MILTSLRDKQLSMVGYNWYISLLAAIENKNINRISANLTDDCVITYIDDHSINGKDQVIEGVHNIWKQFDSIEHEVLALNGSDYSFCSEMQITFRFPSGGSHTLKIVAFVDRNDLGLVNSIRLHADSSQLLDLLDPTS